MVAWGPIIGAGIGAAASLIGGSMGRSSQEKMYEDNIKFQKEFAKHGVRWKVEDAEKAGIHPLAALGASTNSFYPQRVGQDPLASSLSAAGQNIGRAVAATSTRYEKQLATLKLRQESAALENMNLRNVGLRKQIMEMNAPSFPSSKPDNMGIIDSNLPEPYKVEPVPVSDAPGSQLGTGPEGMYKHTRNGLIRYYPSQDAQDLISEDLPAKLSWYRGMAAYKAGMTWGLLTGSKSYKQQKAFMQKRLGKKVYWDVMNMSWRLSSYRPKYSLQSMYNAYSRFGMKYVDHLMKNHK